MTRRSPTTRARLFQERQQSLELLTMTYEFAHVRLASDVHRVERTRTWSRFAVSGAGGRRAAGGRAQCEPARHVCALLPFSARAPFDRRVAAGDRRVQ